MIADLPDVKVTLARDVPFPSPVTIDGRTVLEPGADAVWFTFPGRWHDIGRFHRADGTFTGLYANILTPPSLDAGEGGAPSEGSGGGGDEEDPVVWHTTDLFLDLWLPPGGGVTVLDEDQLAEAEAEGWVSREQARAARNEARRLVREHGRGSWPPAVVEEWTRERALATSGGRARGA